MKTHRENDPLDDIDFSDPLQLLNAFYREIVAIKKKFATKKSKQQFNNDIAAQLKIDTNPSGEQIAEVVSTQLQYWIEKSRAQAHKITTEKEYLRINETLYVAAALADELFIFAIDWPGKKFWQNVLLEERIFKSCYAGEKFYQGINRLTNKQILDSQEKSLVVVYFLAICLGFYGRHRGSEKNISHYRNKLYKTINAGSDDGESIICLQAYQHVFSSMQDKRLAPLSRWYQTMCILFIAYLFFSLILWLLNYGDWNPSDQLKKQHYQQQQNNNKYEKSDALAANHLSISKRLLIVNHKPYLFRDRHHG
ncbi:MAG: DotU family type IV/VI secretion system protein [Cellvibrionaceae bacterium]|nr:DotU family type IV/VI secretion system protein [Cellvibrionaceae bacterium]